MTIEPGLVQVNIERQQLAAGTAFLHGKGIAQAHWHSRSARHGWRVADK